MTDSLLAASVNFISTDFSISDLSHASWRQAESLALNRSWTGEAAPESRHAAARMLWSQNALYVRFDCMQKEPLVLSVNPRVDAKTMQLWERDVCEIFIAPDRAEPRRYVELEIAPTGEWLDLMVDWRQEEPRDWQYLSRMETFAAIQPEKVILTLRVPWSAFGQRPNAGDIWLGNLFRQVGSGERRGYLAWSPTETEAPQFHVPEKFGRFIFAG
jgi:hypothetical protein